MVPAMRLALLTLCLVGSSGWAQQRSGSWGGYVSGWAADQQRPSFFVGNRNLAAEYAPRVSVPTVNPYWAAQAIAAQQLVVQQTYVEEQARVARREREASERAMLAQEQLAAEQQALADQRVQLAQQQRLIAERELAAQQLKLASAQESAALQLAAATEQQRAVTQQLAAATATSAARQKEKEDDERRAELSSKPREKGPDIYRWTDEEGVVHLSTRPPKR